MARIGFIGLGNMGLPMATNLIKAGHEVKAVDVSRAAADKLAAAGGKAVDATAAAAARAEVVITMLPSGKEVRDVYSARSSPPLQPGTLLIDSSTIDVATARAVAAAAEQKDLAMVDAPVSGGVGGAQAGTLTFMVGGSDAAFDRAKPMLEAMGKTIVHAGGPGNGQAAKICNNMILGRVDDRGVGGVRARREARARRAEAVRHLLEVLGPVLVDDELLPGARAGADLAREPRLPGRLHRRDDAQGLEARAGRRARRAAPTRRSARRPPRSTTATSATEMRGRTFPGSSGSCEE